MQYQRAEIVSLSINNLTLEDFDQNAVLKDLSADFSLNAVTWLKGDQSKSLLLRVMAALARPTAGEYLINGQNVFDLTFEEFLPYRFNIGYTFALGGLINEQTLQENLMLPLQIYGYSKEEAQRSLEGVIEMFNLEEYLALKPSNVPGIVRKWCCLARTLASEPQVVFFDEPAKAVGLPAVNALREWLLQRKGRISALIASDSPELFKGLECEERVIVAGKWVGKAA